MTIKELIEELKKLSKYGNDEVFFVNKDSSYAQIIEIGKADIVQGKSIFVIETSESSELLVIQKYKTFKYYGEKKC